MFSSCAGQRQTLTIERSIHCTYYLQEIPDALERNLLSNVDRFLVLV